MNDIACPFPAFFFISGPEPAPLPPRGPLCLTFPFLPARVLPGAAVVAAAINSMFDGTSTVSGRFDIVSFCLSSSTVSKGSGLGSLGLGRSRRSSFADDDEPPAVAPFVGSRDDGFGGNKAVSSEIASVLWGCNRIRARRSVES